MSWIALVHGFYIINLEDKPERLRQTYAVLDELGVPNTRVHHLKATRATPGFLGCATSHYRASRLARTNMERDPDKTFRYACILEDDIMLHGTAQDVHSAVDGVIKHRGGPDKMDAIHLAMTPIRIKPCSTRPGARVWCSYGLAGTLFHRDFLPVVETTYKSSVDSKTPVDVMFSSIQGDHRVYGFYPPVMRQRPGFSDIEGKVVDYAYLEVEGRMIR